MHNIMIVECKDDHLATIHRPTVVLSPWPGGGYRQQQVQHAGPGGSLAAAGQVKWRVSQFRSPECNYRLRARVDTEKLPSENIQQVTI